MGVTDCIAANSISEKSTFEKSIPKTVHLNRVSLKGDSIKKSISEKIISEKSISKTSRENEVGLCVGHVVGG